MRRTFITISLLVASFAVGAQTGGIHDAAAAGDLDKVKALLAANPTLMESKDDRYGNTPLISACFGPGTNGQHATVANYLIDKGADINARNNAGATPLYAATKNFDLTQRLIALKADVNIRAYMPEYTPLHEAAVSGNVRVAKLLLDHGADPNFHGAIGTVLQKVIYNKGQSAPEMAELLLKNRARIDQRFSFGNTELHLAVLRDYEEIIPLLIKYGADVDAVNEYGHTPLYYAARHGHRTIVDALIRAGAKKSAVVETNYGKAPQLGEGLGEGEAYLWYLGGATLPYSGYAVKTKDHLLLFNPTEIDDSPEAGLANGRLNPSELAGQKITGLILNSSYQGQSGPSVSELGNRLPGITIVLNFKPPDSSQSSVLPTHRVVAPHENLSVQGVQVHTIPALGRVGYLGEGLGYLVEADGVKVFHAGLHAAANDDAPQRDAYRKEIDSLKPFGPIDIAILPVSGRHITVAYEPYLYLIDQLSPKAIYLIGDDLTKEEHRKCIEVLRARRVAVFYPEGGIAVGRRFRYVRSQFVGSAAAGRLSREHRSAPDTAESDGSTTVCIDADGNVYRTVTIGTQVWMAEDLKTTRYRNGDRIGTTTPAALDIRGENSPAYQWAYDGDEKNVATYGRLYTWHAVTDARSIAPPGWHVPADEEWQRLRDSLGGPDVAGGKLKAADATLWRSANPDATNSTGFTALPSGARWGDGSFSQLGEVVHYWTRTAAAPDPRCAWRWLLQPERVRGTNVPTLHQGYAPKTIGFPVRCVRDAPANDAQGGARSVRVVQK